MVEFGITVDCANARRLAQFWRLALDYDDAPPPDGWPTWAAFLTATGVPEREWDDVATIRPRTAGPPSITFLAVPEPKTGKNRLHLDLKVSGGRALAADLREERIRARQEDLVAAGAVAVREERLGGDLDHVVLRDPEGNEFCVV